MEKKMETTIVYWGYIGGFSSERLHGYAEEEYLVFVAFEH